MGVFQKFKEKFTKPKATISLKLGKNSMALGENLEGMLVVTAEEEVDATEIRAELRCEQRKKTMKSETETRTLPDGRKETRPVWKEVWETANLFSANPQGSGPLHLSPGYKGEFPFSVSIPPLGQPSFSAPDRTVTWTVKGVIGIKGRPDVTTESFPLLVTPVAGAQPVVTERVIERQVIMIPCRYCGGLMHQTAAFCPQCGAKR